MTKNTWGKKSRPYKIALVVILGLILLGVAGFVTWASNPLGPAAEAQQAMRSDSQVTVENGRWLAFHPVGSEPQSGLIYYPGGRVDYRSYAPYARALAEAGYLVLIPPMPLNLAVFAPDVAAEIMAAYPQIEHWVLAGHSLGGVMAARYAYQHPDQVDGLVLLAAYPANNNNLSQSRLPVVSLYGTNDGLADPAKIEASKKLLPANTRYVPIPGGNHSQLGWYGTQPGDNPASISHQAQQDLVVASIVELFKQIEG
jgi:pimeloyl-ACP methyl ester carboxylesterase